MPKNLAKQKELNDLVLKHGNIGEVCPDCIEKRKKEVKHDYKAGDYIKLCFDGRDGEKEHMWVEIKKFSDDPIKCKSYILGELANEPIYATHLKCGDKIILEKENINEIEEVFYS